MTKETHKHPPTSLETKIESLLLVATKPLKVKKIKELIKGVKESDVRQAVDELKEKYNQSDSGFHILENRGVVQLTTSPASADLVKQFIKDETTGELTKPSLETLTIVAYRQPITKAELEQIRGVNCSLILRNLMIRGLIMKKEDKRALTNYYYVTVDFLKFLGISSVAGLPDYEKLNNNSNLQKLLNPSYQDDEANGSGTGDPTITDNQTEQEKSEPNEDQSNKADDSVSDESVRLNVNIYS